MRRIASAFLALLISVACSPKILWRTVTEYRDSLVQRTDTVRIPVPKEVYVNVVPDPDTSRLRTSFAESEAWLDTAAMQLRHTLRNRDTVLRAEVVVKDRIITRDSVVFREREVPVDRIVKVAPKSYWWLLGWFVITIAGASVIVFFKMRS